jgi:hypothetical protein
MNRLIPYLLVGLVVLGFVALAWLLDAVKDRVTAVVLALILYILHSQWKIGNLEQRVESLENQLAASAAPAASAPTLAELGDLRDRRQMLLYDLTP